MVAKEQAGTIQLNKITFFKEDQFKNLVEVQIEKLYPTHLKPVKQLASFALASARQLGIRLNEWENIEIDIIQHDSQILVDVNFLNKGKVTHTVVGVKLNTETYKAYAFSSVCVSCK